MTTRRNERIENVMHTILMDCWYNYDTPDSWGEDTFVIVDDPDTIEKYFEMIFPVDTPDLDEIFYVLEMDWGYYDEYAICDEYGIVIRTQPDNAWWVPDYWISDCTILSGDYIRDNPDEYIEYFTNNHKDANTIFNDEQLESMGWINTNNDKYCRMFEHCDYPQAVLKETQEQYPDYDVLFSITAQNMFETDYVAWIKEKECD